VVHEKLAPPRLLLPPVSVKARWVGPHEQVLNVSITTHVINSCNITLIVNEINGLNQFHEFLSNSKLISEF
jgi:hypothetical protein